MLIGAIFSAHRFSSSIIIPSIHTILLSIFIFGSIGLTKSKGIARLLLSTFYALPLFFRIAYESDPSVGSLMSLYSTNTSEVTNFISENLAYLSLSIFTFFIIWIFPTNKINKNTLRAALLIGTAYILLGTIKDFISKSEDDISILELKYTAKGYSPLSSRALVALDFAILRLPNLSLLVSISDTIKFHLSKSTAKRDLWKNIGKISSPDKLLILIIGESQRADHLRLFGYPRNTTPHSQKLKEQLFSIKAVSGGTNTWTSLPSTLSFSDKSGQVDISRNIIGLSKKAGYKTWWISNQAHISNWDFGVSSIASQSDYSFFSSKNGYKNIPPDSLILPHFLKILKQAKRNNKPDLVVLHLYGSHPTFEDRYPDNFNLYNDGSTRSKYDNSILYTDSVLYRAIRIIERFNGEFIYFSDHGLIQESNPNIDFKHDVRNNPSIDSVIVPLISNKKLDLSDTVNLYFFECIFSEWAGIETDDINDNHCRDASGSDYGFFLDANLVLRKIKVSARVFKTGSFIG